MPNRRRRPRPPGWSSRRPCVPASRSIYPKGDVTVIGSVASGAEVFAGGSVHVYGTLRGRVVAGFTGNPAARVFCRRLEAELVAIDGVYRTADDMDAALRGRAVQAWLDGGSMSWRPWTDRGEGEEANGDSPGSDIRQGRGRQDNLDRGARRRAGAERARTSAWSISTSACATWIW